MARHPLEIKRLDAGSLEATIECVARLYPGGNIIAGALGFTADDYRPFAARTARSTLASDSGLVVVDPADGAAVGFFFVRDLVDQLAALEAMAIDEDARIRAWGDMLGRLITAHGETFGAPVRGQVLYINIMALDERARGRGLTHELTMRAGFEFGFERGYRSLLGVATHPRAHDYVAGTFPEWSASVEYSILADARLNVLPGAARIVRYDIAFQQDSDFEKLFAPRPAQ